MRARIFLIILSCFILSSAPVHAKNKKYQSNVTDPFSSGGVNDPLDYQNDAPLQRAQEGARFSDPGRAALGADSYQSHDYLGSNGYGGSQGNINSLDGLGATNSFSTPNNPSSLGGEMYGPMEVP